MDASTSSATATEPTWLDLEYIHKIINKYTENQLKVVKTFSKAPATSKGENYVSEMTLVNAEYITKNAPENVHKISLIVKSRLDNELMTQIEEDFNMFQREAQTYAVIMDEAYKLLKSIDDDETIFAPNAFYVDERVIVLENLKLLGYSIEDVKQGLDFEQCSLVLKKLAKFHAVTMVLYKQQPQIFRHHLPGNVTENPTPLHELYINVMKSCIEYCEHLPQLQQYVPQLKSFGDKIIPKMINVYSRNQTDRFHVLNHGDVWVNNLMFRKDATTGKCADMLFVDFQEGFYGSPGIDLNFFIFTSWQLAVFRDRRIELLELYQKNLSDVLLKLNYELRIPTVEDVRKEIVNKAFHGLATATCMLPMMINERIDLADPLNFLLDTAEVRENRRIIFDNPKYAERLEVFLSFFAEKSIL